MARTSYGPLASSRLDFDRYLPDDLRLISAVVLFGTGMGAGLDLGRAGSE